MSAQYLGKKRKRPVSQARFSPPRGQGKELTCTLQMSQLGQYGQPSPKDALEFLLRSVSRWEKELEGQRPAQPTSQGPSLSKCQLCTGRISRGHSAREQEKRWSMFCRVIYFVGKVTLSVTHLVPDETDPAYFQARKVRPPRNNKAHSPATTPRLEAAAPYHCPMQHWN